MVRNGNCLMPPCNRAFDIFFHRCHTIHTAHLCMQMQLHALFLRIIHTGSRRGGSHDIFRHNIDFLGIFIKLHFALHAQIFTLFDFIAQFGIKNTFLHEKFHCSRIAQIRNIKGNNIFFTTNFSRLDVINTALDNDIFPENFRINNLLVCAVDFFAKQNPLGNDSAATSALAFSCTAAACVVIICRLSSSNFFFLLFSRAALSASVAF